MKIAMIVFLISIFNAFGTSGFNCKHNNSKIIKDTKDGITTLVVHDETNKKQNFNPNLRLSSLDDTKGYQERFGIYKDLTIKAQMNFPYMPEFLVLFHMMKSNKAYHKGFVQIEEGSSFIELNKMYCNGLIKAILEY